MNKIKSCLYCRVSTQNEEQNTSYKHQQNISVKGYDIIKVYADRGTGTNIKRKNFQQMLYDCGVDIKEIEGNVLFIASDRKAMFESIIVTHTSRFLRNQLLMKLCIKALKKKNVEIYFSDMNKSSLDNDIEFVLNILFLLDEQESRNTSQKIKKGLERSRKDKKYIQVPNRLWGYDYIKEENKLIINKDGKIIKEIFDMYLNGLGYRKICLNLKEKYNIEKNSTDIKNLLNNSRYCGYNFYNKWTVSRLDGIKKKNKDYDIFPSDKIEPIVSYEDWCKVQNIIKSKSNGRQGLKHNMYPLSQKIKCGSCGCSYVRKREKRGNYVRVFWSCKTKFFKQKGECINPNITERIIVKHLLDKDLGIKSYIRAIELELKKSLNDIKGIDTKEIDDLILKVENKRKKLLDIYIEELIDKETFEIKNNDLIEEKNILVEKLNFAKNINSTIEELNNISITYKDKLENYYELLLQGKYDDVFNKIENIFVSSYVSKNEKGEFKLKPRINKVTFKDFSPLNKIYKKSPFGADFFN